MDLWQIPIGDYFESKIEKAIRKSDFVLLILSRNSIQSDWVKKEVITAQYYEKKMERTLLLPARIDDSTPPMWISNKSYADFTLSYEGAFRQLILAVGGTPPKFANIGSMVSDLLQSKTADGNHNLLTALYDKQFEYDNNWTDKKIVDNILSQIDVSSTKQGIALDIDSGQLVGKIPLTLKDIKELIATLQDAYQIILDGDILIKELYNIPNESTFANDAVYRTIVLEMAARIKTNFRQVLPIGALDIDTGERKPEMLSISSVSELLEQTKIKLQIKNIPQIAELYGMKDTPYRASIETLGVEQWFFPCIGYNIL